MKNLLIALTLAITSCAGVQPGNVPVADGPVARTISRVLDRTDVYLQGELLLIGAEQREVIEAALLTARVMTAMEEVSGSMLLGTMSGVMDLHDTYIMVDEDLDQLERDIYLEDTARLRSLFDSASVHAVQPALVGPGPPNPDFLA